MTEQTVTAQIVVHELTHAAAVIYRRDVNRDLRLGTGFGDVEREEIFVRIVSELTAWASLAFTRRALWTAA